MGTSVDESAMVLSRLHGETPEIIRFSGGGGLTGLDPTRLSAHQRAGSRRDGFLVTMRITLMARPSTSAVDGPSTDPVDALRRIRTGLSDDNPRRRVHVAILDFHGLVAYCREQNDGITGTNMTEPRLTKEELQRFGERAIRVADQKQEANRRAYAERIAKGRKRLEKTVPVDHLPELRRIVAEFLDAFDDAVPERGVGSG